MLDLSPCVDGLPDSDRADLTEAAFGSRPGIAVADLPVGRTPVEFWLRAVALGGQGRYAAARAQLLVAARRTRDPVLGSLLASTEASLLRQLGRHARAEILDGRAAVLAVGTAHVGTAPDRAQQQGSERASDPMRTAAVCDALTGLAADALGTGGPRLSARLLRRCRTEMDRAPAGLRAQVRWHWVSAETELAAPGARLTAEPASVHADAAVTLSEELGSVRHQVKSRLLVAAAAAGAGEIERSRTLADAVDAQCAEFGLLPLRWAAAMLRSGVGAPSAAARASAQAAEYARVLAGRGGQRASRQVRTRLRVAAIPPSRSRHIIEPLLLVTFH